MIQADTHWRSAGVTSPVKRWPLRPRCRALDVAKPRCFRAGVVLGRFPLQGWFVAMEWRPRSVGIDGFDKVPLADTCAGDEWMFATIEVEQRWNKIIPGAEYVTGGHLHDYISANCNLYGH